MGNLMTEFGDIFKVNSYRLSPNRVGHHYIDTGISYLIFPPLNGLILVKQARVDKMQKDNG
jgi:hypothetical protein